MALLLGGGVDTVVISQTSGDQMIPVVRPHVGVGALIPVGHGLLTGALGGGATGAALAGDGWIGFALDDDGITPILGVQGGVTSHAFEEVAGERTLRVSRSWAAVGAGMAF